MLQHAKKAGVLLTSMLVAFSSYAAVPTEDPEACYTRDGYVVIDGYKLVGKHKVPVAEYVYHTCANGTKRKCNRMLNDLMMVGVPTEQEVQVLCDMRPNSPDCEFAKIRHHYVVPWEKKLAFGEYCIDNACWEYFAASKKSR